MAPEFTTAELARARDTLLHHLGLTHAQLAGLLGCSEGDLQTRGGLRGLAEGQDDVARRLDDWAWGVTSRHDPMGRIVACREVLASQDYATAWRLLDSLCGIAHGCSGSMSHKPPKATVEGPKRVSHLYAADSVDSVDSLEGRGAIFFNTYGADLVGA